MKSNKLYKLVITALFTALTCASTIVIQIPSAMNGYVNLGDCFVLMSGWLLGPVYGFCAAGLGSMLADMFTGYMHYAPATLIIKGLVAVIAALLFNVMKKACPKHPRIGRIISGTVGELFMVAGYFGYAALLLGNGLTAATSIPGNLIQSAIGIVAAMLLIEVVYKLNLMRKWKEDEVKDVRKN